MRQISARDRSVPRPVVPAERNARAPRPSTGRNADADATFGVLAVRRTPVYDPFDDHDDPSHDPGPNVRRISTSPAPERPPRRGEVRPLHASRRVPPRRGPDPRVWFIRGSIGVAALAGLWLGLQALFPVTESRVSQAPTPAPADRRQRRRRARAAGSSSRPSSNRCQRQWLRPRPLRRAIGCLACRAPGAGRGGSLRARQAPPVAPPRSRRPLPRPPPAPSRPPSRSRAKRRPRSSRSASPPWSRSRRRPARRPATRRPRS